MPYIIAVLFLVVIGTGFALSQPKDSEQETPTLEALVEEIKETASSTLTKANNDEQKEIEIMVVSDENQNTQSVNQTEPVSTSVSVPTPAPAPVSIPTPTPAPVVINDYRNGTYNTSVSYRTPDGTYQMNVTMGVSDDKVTSANVSFTAGGGDGYSKRFSKSYQSSIIGQDLGTASLSRVGGASLTTRAFNNALNDIRSQAS